MKGGLQESYRLAGEIARTRARNFYYSFLALPQDRRRAICAVYAFMRRCDDIADGPASVSEKQVQLRRWRDRLDASVAVPCDSAPFLPAFHDAVARFSIPVECFHWMIDGVEMDLTVDRYQTFEDLYRYCFCVASSVGLACLHIFGFSDERARKYAEYCGIAFQLTNILRDIREDTLMGRTYLPIEDLQRFRYSGEDLRNAVLDDRFRRLMAFETNRARKYYVWGRNLLPLVDGAGRPALWAMMEIYNHLLRKIARRRYDVFGPAIRLSRRVKMSIALRAMAMRLLPG